MALLRTLFGSLTSSIVRLAVAAAILLLAYLIVVKPALQKTEHTIEGSGIEQIGKSLEGVGNEIKRDVRHSFETTSPGSRRRKLAKCIRSADGDVHRIERCARRF